ncbi:MAG TPA: ATP-binding protein [Pyrinomonadaceae bacterium]|jgi:hypothetical protein
MKTLDDDLITLSKLSDSRKRARKLWSDGLQALKKIPDREAADSEGWRMSDDAVESALLALVQNRDVTKRRGGGGGSSADKEESFFVKEIANLTLEELTGPWAGASPAGASFYDRQEHEKVPVLVAARAMHALVVSSTHAFTPASLLCYYRIVRELYSADSPDWSTGGARAGNGGESTAFMTGESVRAISALARTHRQTATFFRSTHELYLRREHLLKLSDLGRWRDAEIERTGLAWYNSTASQLGELALNLPPRPEPSDRIDDQYVKDYLDELSRKLENSIVRAKENFLEALLKIKEYRKKEKLWARQSGRPEHGGEKSWRRWNERYFRSESAHRMALSVVRQAVARANGALKICRANKNILDGLQQLSELFESIDCDIKRVLEPAQRFLSARLDRELTAASAPTQSAWDARELVFAAASYGAVSGWKPDERLTRACALLSDSISERGLFPPGRPFHSTANGFSLYASSFEVARGFAQLLHRTDYPVTPQLAGRMLQLFEDHSLALKEVGPSGSVCWHAEDPPIPRRPTLWATAVAVLALERIVLMLGHKVNEGVLAHFSALRYDKARGSDATGPRLEDLSFPDYALCPLPPDAPRDLPPEQQRTRSVVITLEQMRAHVLGTGLPAKYAPTFSAVLFGPPGTGKTTLLKALARSSRRPLVQITPSDIARAGEQWIEKSAKQIFDALSMLTGVVIIFDEFEPILLKRDPSGQKEERSIFTFLTPGMLPKLTKLYEAAEEQGIAYCLVTNHYQKLDEAAIRRGRFDEHIVIYHPDYISRAGMFLDRLRKRPEVSRVNEGRFDEGQRRRFDEVIKRTSHANIQDLAKDSFRVPEAGTPLQPGTYASYVITGDKPERFAPARPAPDVDHAGLTPLEEWREKKERDLADSSIWESL